MRLGNGVRFESSAILLITSEEGSMKTVSYEAFHAYDPGDGPLYTGGTIGYFSKEEDAKEVAKGRGAWGGDAIVEHVKMKVKIFDSMKEFEDDKVKSKRKKALAKLSEEDRKLLGLDE